MKRKTKFISIVLVVLAIAAGCNRSTDANATPVKNIVKINGQTYTSKDLWDYSNVVLWEMEPKDLDSAEVRDKILQDFIEHKLLLEEAEKRGISAYHDKQANPLYSQWTTEEGAKELKAVTGQYDMDANKVAQLAEERLIIDELSQLVVTNMNPITEDELKRYYESKAIEKNPVGIAHILHIFTTEQAKAQEAAKELSSGITFSEVARKYSEGPEKTAGGDLGFIKESDYPEFFSDAFKLKEGEVSAVIQSDYGYHIFKMVQYANAARTSYENVKQQLLAELYVQKRQEMIREFINALHSNADIQYLNDFTLDELFPKRVER